MIAVVGLNTDLNIEKDDLLAKKAYFGNFEVFEKGKLKGITVNHLNFGSEWRQLDFDFFTSQENRSKLKEYNIELITWKDIKRIGM